MASYRDRRTQPSMAQQLFGKIYVPQIADMILKKHGGSYACYENDRNTWRAFIPYSKEIEAEFIMETKMFIGFMDRHVGHLANNPEFLNSFVKLVVDYLSAYTMKNPVFPNRTRKKAKEALFITLWTDFIYIQKKLARQAAQRAARQERNVRYNKGGKNNSEANDSAESREAYAKYKATQRRLASAQSPKQR